MEANQVYYTFQGQAVDEGVADPDEELYISKDDALVKFIKFIREWRRDNKLIYKYAKWNFLV